MLFLLLPDYLGFQNIILNSIHHSIWMYGKITKIMLKINVKTINATQSSKKNENATSTCLCCNHRLFYTKISHIATL